MADIESSGYDGTVNESDFAKIMQLAGVRYSVAGALDFQVTAVPGQRQVQVAAGVAYGVGVRCSNPDPKVLDIGAPSTGQWSLVTLHRKWSDNSSVVTVVPGAATAASPAPTVPPTVFPTIDQQPGVEDDQPLAWVWAVAGSTNLVIFDARDRMLSDQLAIIDGSLTELLADVDDLKTAGPGDAATVNGIDFRLQSSQPTTNLTAKTVWLW